jgi:ankyrin repeat protein
MGAHTEAKNAIGATPLHVAAETGCVGCVVALMESGADMEAVTNVRPCV